MNKRLLLILLLALLLRLAFVLAQDPLAPYRDFSGDTGWYLPNAYTLVTGEQTSVPTPLTTRFTPENFFKTYQLFRGLTVPLWVQVSKISSPPLYFIILGTAQAVLSPAGAMLAVRVLQAVLSTATCYFAYRLAIRLTKRENAGLLAAFVLAVSPVFIIEVAQILTETVFIFLLTGGIWLYVESIVAKKRGVALLLLAAVFLGLAVLTRAVLLALPFGLAVHLLLVYGWREGIKRAAPFLLVYALVVLSWTAYSVARWNRFVIAGEGLPAFFYMGAAGWAGAEQVDEALAQQSLSGNYTQAASNAIGSDPLGWAARRVSELAAAYLQPYGTTFFRGESLRDLAVAWLQTDRSAGGLVALTQGEAFWQKLALYLFHYTALIAGLLGIWRTRRRWQVGLPILGVIAYFTLVHLVLYAQPRYLFPVEVFWWVFAAAAFFPPRESEAGNGR